MLRFSFQEHYKYKLYLKYYNALQLYNFYNNELIWSIREKQNKTTTY